ncbi:HNH endonuclease signature motif containing protein [Microbacterium sp.]|uniref:HNH endonuclease signature motif containing protein n=1 Tax=Microbacterium sp. TaxID=51671 RepID=UPI002FE0E4C1
MESPTQHDLEQRQTMLDAWVAKRREIARLESEAMELLADRMRLGDADARENPHHRDTIHRSMIAEYSAAGHASNGSVDRAFADAAVLEGHPAVRASFQQGAITAAHVREIISAGAVVRQAVRDGRVDAGTLGMYDEAAVVVGEQDTPMRTRALVRQLAAALAGATVVERHRIAAAERTVTMRSVDDGLALISIVLPEHLAAAVMDRLTRLARQVIAARDDVEPLLDMDLLDDGEDPVFPEDLDWSDPMLDESAIFGDDTFTTDPLPEPCVEVIPADTRTMDQLRADLMTDLLLTSDPTTPRGTAVEHVQARIQVTVAATTLAGTDDRPAELDGFGPIDPDIARELAAGTGGWSRLFLDPTGMITESDTYTPTEAMRRFLRARDQHCRFPGCRMPVHRCQIDHNHDHALGGRTTLDNLSHFCTGHHVLKHPGIDDRHRWSARQRAGGDIEWISPLGHSYTDQAPRRVMFV